jgi:hypothetical protein
LFEPPESTIPTTDVIKLLGGLIEKFINEAYDHDSVHCGLNEESVDIGIIKTEITRTINTIQNGELPTPTKGDDKE